MSLLRGDALNNPMHRYAPLISLALFIVASLVMHHEISSLHWQEIRAAVLGMPLRLLFEMIGLTLAGYVALSFYDYLALEYAGERLPYRRVLPTSFLGYAFRAC